MRSLLLALTLLALCAIPAFAASLTWSPVTTDVDGEPLGLGQEVTQYRVYRCGPGIGSCTLGTATLIGTVTAPTVQFNISSEPTPSVYLVTASNIVGESAASIPYKVSHPRAPENPSVK